MANQQQITPYSDDSWQRSEDQSGLQDNESSGLLTNNESRTEGRISQNLRWQTRTGIVVITVFNIVLFGFSILSLGTTWYHQGFHIANAELRRPVYDSIDLGLHETQVNGTFYPPEPPSIARQMPNPIADSVWENYELVRPIRLTKAQLIRMGNDPSKVSKFEDKHWGFGDDAYVGDLDVFHQLHCLNTLRRYAYADYYNVTALNASDANSVMALHVNHCVDILLQEIQCNGNVGFITSQWVENQRYPQPDIRVA
ncbi:hypothetical protein ONZ43_g2723 [Nemania bipapillata]|uniref:Uncharacterized protein n=1 Tax=Nemania bipapillata TaxID=110536 RepID=A0ACC2IZG4_9PEZI|nr:hypothetical protein ONZ43_g2723 [Nemania bipapillata]